MSGTEPLKSLVLRTAVRAGSYRAAARMLGLPAYRIRRILLNEVGIEGIHTYRPIARSWDPDSVRLALEMYRDGWHPESIAIFFNRPVEQVTRLLVRSPATSAAL